MAKRTSFHTDSPEYDPENRAVHHNDDECFEGQKILGQHRQAGNGGKPLCTVCAVL
ncbi:MAG: hypothetical protein QOG88_1471 [Actinomycetota bacterium]|jgi:hypothetical protein|nr:hypothetical protein [Actinomycetota bacterium]